MEKNIINKNEYMIEWPGWSLKNNKYGNDFDSNARMRMITTGKKLLPYLLNYINNLGKSFLEIGPFFTPLLFSEELTNVLEKDIKITFLENDQNVIKWLNNKYDCEVISSDINTPNFQQNFQQNLLDNYGMYKGFYSTITMSQIINYIDYVQFLKCIYPSLKKGGLLFINNVIDYGIPELFSDKRPKSNNEIVEYAINIGYKVVDQILLPKEFAEEPHKRLILILTK